VVEARQRYEPDNRVLITELGSTGLRGGASADGLSVERSGHTLIDDRGEALQPA
jgi:hypothetical protein